jgi:hypothetical protein
MSMMSIDLVRVYDKGRVVPMYHVHGITKETWKAHEPIANSYYVGQDNYGSPLFMSYESALKALMLVG